MSEKYTWSDKTTAVTKYMSLGNMRLVSELTEVPYDTLMDWKKQEWWNQISEDIKRLKKTKQGQKLTEIIEVGTEVIADRLKNGDYIFNNKTQEVIRKPVSLKDAASATNQLLARQLQLEELADRMERRTESVQDTLSLLAKEFAKWNRINNKKAQDIAFKEITNDSENGQGLSSEVGDGEEFIEADVIEVSGVEETEAGGIFQAQG